MEKLTINRDALSSYHDGAFHLVSEATNETRSEYKTDERGKTMYATINLPGSLHFEYYGPASKVECQEWLTARVTKLQETEQVTSLLPQRIVSNKDAESWRYLDGSQVCRPQLSEADLEAAFGPKSLPCGCPGTGHVRSCPGFGLR